MSGPSDGSGFPRGFFFLPLSIAINIIISEEKICFDLERKFFFCFVFYLKKHLCNWLTVWEKLFSQLKPYKSQFQMD